MKRKHLHYDVNDYHYWRSIFRKGYLFSKSKVAVYTLLLYLIHPYQFGIVVSPAPCTLLIAFLLQGYFYCLIKIKNCSGKILLVSFCSLLQQSPMPLYIHILFCFLFLIFLRAYLVKHLCLKITLF